MKNKAVFITGISSGIGKALIESFDELTVVFGIGRSNPNKIDKFLDLDLSSKKSLYHFEFPELREEINEVWLINNAGIIGNVTSFVNQTEQDLEEVFQVNLLSPVVLMKKFQKTYNGLTIKIINISSGAASSPIRSWSAYCGSKAGLEMFTNTVLSEQADEKMQVYSIAPGVVDSEMQNDIRKAGSSDFPDSEKFHSLFNNKELVSPKKAAQTLIQLINENNFGGIHTLRDYYR